MKSRLRRVAILQVRLRRLLRRVLQREHPLAFHAARLCALRGGGDVGFRQAVEQRLVVDDDGRGVRVGEDAIAELRGELRLLLIQRPQRGLVGLVELRAGADEVLVVTLDEDFCSASSPSVSRLS